MSLADDWDAIPASATAAAAPGAAGRAASLADEWESIKPEEAKAAAKAAQPPDLIDRSKEAIGKVGDILMAPTYAAGNALTGLGHSIAGGWQGLAVLAGGGTMEDAAKAVESPQVMLPVVGRTDVRTYDPKAGTAGAALAAANASPYNPMNYAADAAEWVGDKTYEKAIASGVSPQTAAAEAAAAKTALNAVPMMLGGSSEAATVVRPRMKLVGSSSIADVQRPAAIPESVNYDVPTVLRRRAAVPVEAGTAPASAPAAQGAPSVAVPIEAPPEAAAAAAEAAAPKYEAPPPAAPGQKLPVAEQQRRAQVLNRIGIGGEVRESAITGDRQAAADDFQTSRLNNDAGELLHAKLEAERGALTTHAEQIVQDTGGTLGTDAQTLETRGHTILAPLDALKQWFDGNTRALYKVADERAGGVAADMPSTHALIGGDQADFLGTQQGEALLRGVKARMKSLGMTDAEGAPAQATVAQAERLKQYLNTQWQPQTARLIRSVKDAIDEDVTSTAGEDVYKQARAMRAMRAVTLDDPNGIAKIMDASGPEGINRSVPTEKIPDAITAMPNAQFAHIVKTLQAVPPELAPQAQAALAEIKAQFANRLRDAGASRVGQWGARDVTAYLNKNAAKMQLVFSPEELAKIGDLNDAGHILAKDQSYPGAAVQAHNLATRGVMVALRSGFAGVGSLIGGPLAAAAGDLVGSGVASKFGRTQELRAAQKRMVKLSDFLK